MYTEARYLPAGDTGLTVEFGNQISREVNEKVRNLAVALERDPVEGIIETIPTYCSLFILYDPGKTSLGKLISAIKGMESRLEKMDLPRPVVTEIPVLYGGDWGPDLEYVARYNGLTLEEVVKIHSSVNYLIYMLGFAPGFPYLGGMPEKIATPRLKKPRVCIPAGSVGIADRQTGIYPLESPAGWQLIGRTPVRLYDPDRETPILLKAGDYIRFRPINREEYNSIAKEVNSGRYYVKRWEL